MTPEEAKAIEEKYHELYKVSDQWVQDKLEQAKKDGYVTCAFGLKLRTPLLKTAVTSGNNALREAQAEARTAGNALGQSWCLLNLRAANEVMEKVWNSEYRYDILPCCSIHDASYFFIRDNIKILEWFNKVLINAMRWQEHPDIQHDQVKLGAELEVFYPDWAHGIDIPNDATKEQIREVLKKANE